eukprot:scaffold21500_cov119-Cylindrotheca_fusiformis.AAC.2
MVTMVGRSSFLTDSASAETTSFGTAKSAEERHCDTCTCHLNDIGVAIAPPSTFACHSSDLNNEPLPPPHPEPTYSVHKRILPSSLTALSSQEGRKYLIESFLENTAESYWALTEQFVNQSDPAFCGITTLLMVSRIDSWCLIIQTMNVMGTDKLETIRWRGGWRFYGSEDVLLDRCCFSAERVRRAGVNMEEFRSLGKCHGLLVEMKRPVVDGSRSKGFSVQSFREDLKRTLTEKESQPIVVVSFSRRHLDQTGEGHFSPIAAFHESTDQVLLLDVARFKYSPYWVSVQALYDSMVPEDESTKKSRGWFVLLPPTSSWKRKDKSSEGRRPAELVPLVGEEDVCPIGELKVRFCRANIHKGS